MIRIASTLIVLLAIAPAALNAQQAGPRREKPPTPPAPNHGNSLWRTQRVSDGNLVSLEPMPVRQFKPEDIITIVIQEESSAASEASLETEKENNLDFTIDAFSRIIKNNSGPGYLVSPTFNVDPQFKYGYNRDNEGEGSMERAERFTTRVAARVIDVKPNGNMVLEAKRELSINGEDRRITLTGVVSPLSVSPANTVYSYDVASAKISYTSSGPVSAATRRGWLTTLVDFVDPF